MQENLTKQQREAVEYTESPLLIVAGPGSGKTKVLTNKAIYLMQEKSLKPNEILMTTFTVKASEEIRQQIESKSDKDLRGMFIGTVHSLCEGIIKEHVNENT